jgi:sugar/nucleoside kinase (ribokinase family)
MGEAIVDLVCERPVGDLADADAFVPHCGGAVANAAIVAARCGAEVSLAGGVGDDAWGHWLAARLETEGVDLRWLSRIPELATPLAFIVVNDRGEPTFNVYGHGIEAGIESFGPRLDEAVDLCSAVLVGSNTLVGEGEREVSLRARDRARRLGKPLVFDPNLRAHRWTDRDLERSLASRFCEGALLVKVNADEARFLTDSSEPATAAERIHRLGATVAVVTLGADGAIARGAVQADVPGVESRVVDATGAGDVVTGVLLAALADAAFEPAAIGEALPAAVAAASRSTEGWGAVDALPPLALRDGR